MNKDTSQAGSNKVIADGMRKTSEYRYLIIRQSDGVKYGSDNLANIANFFNTEPFNVKLHLDHDVQLNGYMIKTNKDFNQNNKSNEQR